MHGALEAAKISDKFLSYKFDSIEKLAGCLKALESTASALVSSGLVYTRWRSWLFNFLVASKGVTFGCFVDIIFVTIITKVPKFVCKQEINPLLWHQIDRVEDGLSWSF